MTDKDRRSAWQALAMSQAWIDCERDLLLFVMSIPDTKARCGAQDVVTYIRDSMIGIPQTQEEM